MEQADLAAYFAGYDASFVLLDQAANKWTIYHETNARKRVPPDSTFKIFSALIGLENHVLKDSDTELPWDGTAYPVEVWNRNHTLRSAMTYSVNWYFEKVNQSIGPSRMRFNLKRLRYGNCDISGGIRDFWGESSLEIAPLEQVAELQKFYTYRLPFTRRNVDIVKDIIKIAVHDGNLLSGKTGTGNVGHRNIRGWFVGYVVTKDNVFYFATHLQGTENADGKTAREITVKILQDKNLY